MANALSLELRQRVVAAVEAGALRRQAAERFGVGVSSAIQLVAQVRTTGDLEPRRRVDIVRAASTGTPISSWTGSLQSRT